VRTPTQIESILLRIAAGGWVQVCRANAEFLHLADFEVELKPFTKAWTPMKSGYEYRARMQFRVRRA
jgi:hypothetical protein